jgi:hypothetical protein
MNQPHTCGYPITVKDEFDGMTYLPVFIDGDETSPTAGQELTRCPQCKDRLLPSAFKPVIVTANQSQIAAMAAAMAANNPDAAEELAKHLAYEANRQKTPQGFGIEIRWNEITEKAELRASKGNR